MPELIKPPEPTKAESAAPILTRRYEQLQDWLQQIISQPIKSIVPLAGDASFRRYFRVHIENKSYVLMDAPPDKEGSATFVAIGEEFKRHGICVPEIYNADLNQGFLLLSDLGDDLYFQKLTSLTSDDLYQKAFKTLLNIQQCQEIKTYSLPEYNHTRLKTEMQLFIDWYLMKYKNQTLSQQTLLNLENLFENLINNALEQPQVCVHRDYHSRNLLLCADGNVGVLDFQDAVSGPITYDLVSLLKDCYISWPQEKINKWVIEYYKILQQNLLLKPEITIEQFTRWFDLMGLQRHLKCLGIFARLHLRDNKPGYLNDIPKVLNDARFVCNKYPEFKFMLPLFID